MSTLHGRHSLNHKYHNSLERQDLSVRALEVTPLSLLRSEGEHSFCRLCPWSAHRPDGFSLQAFPPRGGARVELSVPFSDITIAHLSYRKIRNCLFPTQAKSSYVWGSRKAIFLINDFIFFSQRDTLSFVKWYLGNYCTERMVYSFYKQGINQK